MIVATLLQTGPECKGRSQLRESRRCYTAGMSQVHECNESVDLEALAKSPVIAVVEPCEPIFGERLESIEREELEGAGSGEPTETEIPPFKQVLHRWRVTELLKPSPRRADLLEVPVPTAYDRNAHVLYHGYGISMSPITVNYSLAGGEDPWPPQGPQIIFLASLTPPAYTRFGAVRLALRRRRELERLLDLKQPGRWGAFRRWLTGR